MYIEKNTKSVYQMKCISGQHPLTMKHAPIRLRGTEKTIQLQESFSLRKIIVFHTNLLRIIYGQDPDNGPGKWNVKKYEAWEWFILTAGIPRIWLITILSEFWREVCRTSGRRRGVGNITAIDRQTLDTTNPWHNKHKT